MEKDQQQKHMCKFCSKSFPCGRSLGGHMRSHLINISSSHHKKVPKKRPLPPLDSSIDGGDQLSYDLGKKTSKLSKWGEVEDTLLQGKACKECGKAFQSWKALFGHMKCHSVNGKMTSNVEEEDSWNSSNDHHKLIMDSQSDNEAATPLLKRKRSDRLKRYKANTNSSVSHEIDQQEQEEVALSLIILSRDKGNWGGFMNSIADSSDNSSELLEATKSSPKKLRNVKQLHLKSLCLARKLNTTSDDDELQLECNEESDKISRKRKSINVVHDPQLYQEIEKTSKFKCSICKKPFSSYQALGGHRASHKKFKGSCAPRSENSLETENSHNQCENPITNAGLKKSKDHECPICLKVFPSGQALGGHKRSHVIVDHTKNHPSIEPEKPVEEIRGFLDLNLPAPNEEDEEESNEFKPWWISHKQQEQPLYGEVLT